MPELFGRHYTRQELMRYIGHVSQIGGVQLFGAEDGPARGVRSLEFRTGSGFSRTASWNCATSRWWMRRKPAPANC